MKKRKIMTMLLCLVLVFTLCTASVSAADVDNSTSVSCDTIDAPRALLDSVSGVENAEAVLLYEVSTDTLMYARNADTPMYPSSLTKIMTAMIVLERANLSDIVTVREDVLDSVPKSAAKTYLQVDEVMSVEHLLYSMLVDSANDSTAVLADFVCGSQEAFVQVMNEKAQELGCTNTHFVNVHGLYDKEHLSTARDIAKILKAAIQNEKFVEIFGTVFHTIPATNKYEQRNLMTGNFLMTRGDLQIYYDSRVTGGRTGVAPDGLRCIASTADDGELQMISVIIGSDSIFDENGANITFGGFEETTALLDAGFNGMSNTQLMHPGQAMAQFPVENGNNNVVVGPQVYAYTILPDQLTSKELTYQYSQVSFSAPIEKGQEISTLEIFYNGLSVAKAPMYALNSVDIKEDIQLPNQPGSGNVTVTVLVAVIVVLVLAILFLIGRRYIHHLQLVNRRKRMQNRHRRSR